jgi:hypothetical protein
LADVTLISFGHGSSGEMVVYDWLMKHISNMAMAHCKIWLCLIGRWNTYSIWPWLSVRYGCFWLADETHIQYGYGWWGGMVVFDWLMQHISNMAMAHCKIWLCLIGWWNTFPIWPLLMRRHGCVWLADATHIQYGHGSSGDWLCTIGWWNTYPIWPWLIVRDGCVWMADEIHIQYGHGSL